MKIKYYYKSHDLEEIREEDRADAFIWEIDNNGVWDCTIYISSKFCWIGKAVNLFHARAPHSAR